MTADQVFLIVVLFFLGLIFSIDTHRSIKSLRRWGEASEKLRKVWREERK